MKVLPYFFLFLLAFLVGTGIYLMDTPKTKPTELSALQARSISEKSYNASRDNHNQVKCLNEVLSKVNQAAHQGWSSIVLDAKMICARNKTIETIPMLTKTLRAKGFEVIRANEEFRVRW